MARVKLLRQSLEDYSKRVNVANAEAERRNTAYQQAYDPYAAMVDKYNAGIDALGRQDTSGPLPGVEYMAMNGGLYKPAPGGGFIRVEDMGRELTREEAIALGGASILGEGVAGAGDTLGLGDPDNNPNVPAYDPNDPLYGGLEVGVKEISEAEAQANREGYVKYYLSPQGYARTAYVAPIAPDEPVPVEAPRAPNLTQSDIRELRSPSLDQAGMQRAANRGIIGKNELVGMEMGKNSAFADPNDPNNLKEAGILARTLGGQL